MIRILSISHFFSGKHVSYQDTFDVNQPPSLEPDEAKIKSPLSLGGVERAKGVYSMSAQQVSNQGDVRLVWQHYVVADNGRGERRSRTRPGARFTDFTDEPVYDQDEITYRLVAIQFSPSSRPTHATEAADVTET